MHNVLFLAQMQAGANAIVGIAGLIGMVIAVCAVCFGIWKLLHHDLVGLIPIIAAVGISAWAVPIVNSAYHVVGQSGITLTATNPD